LWYGLKNIEVYGLIKDLQVHLEVHPHIMITMDIVVIDVPDAWGMLLSIKWGADIGGSLQMDLSYATVDLYWSTTHAVHPLFSSQKGVAPDRRVRAILQSSAA